MDWRVTFKTNEAPTKAVLRPLSNEKKFKYASRLFLGLLVVLTDVLQNTPHLFPTIFGVHAFLLLPLVICIAMYQRGGATLFMAALAGALWDMNSGFLDGFNALIITAFAAVTGVLMHYLLRNNIITAMILSGSVSVLYVLIYWLIFILARGVEGSVLLLLTFYLPSALYTFLFTPVFYIIVRAILRKIRSKYPKKDPFIETN